MVYSSALEMRHTERYCEFESHHLRSQYLLSVDVEALFYATFLTLIFPKNHDPSEIRTKR